MSVTLSGPRVLNIGRKNWALHLRACCMWKHTNIKPRKYFRWKSAFHAIFFFKEPSKFSEKKQVPLMICTKLENARI